MSAIGTVSVWLVNFVKANSLGTLRRTMHLGVNKGGVDM